MYPEEVEEGWMEDGWQRMAGGEGRGWMGYGWQRMELKDGVEGWMEEDA